MGIKKSQRTGSEPSGGAFPSQVREDSRYSQSTERQELVRELLAGGAASQAVSLLTGAIIVYALWHNVPHIWLVGWYATLVVGSIARIAFVIHSRATLEDRNEIPSSTRGYLFGVMFTAMVWAATPWLLQADPSVYAIYFVGMMMAGMCAGAVHVLSPLPHLPVVFVVPVLLSLIAFLIWRRPEYWGQACLVAIVYGSVMLRIARDLHRRIYRSIRDRSKLTELAREYRDTAIGLRTLFNLTPSPIAFIDQNQFYRDANRFYREFFNLRDEEIVGRHVREVLGDQTYATIQKGLENALSGQEHMFLLRIPRPGNQIPRLMRVQYMPEQEDDGNIIGVVVLAVDVTHEYSDLNKWKQKASLDPLTSLPNRREFMRFLGDMLVETEQGKFGDECYLCYLDLNAFKPLNDQFGHWTGDEVLRQVARVLSDQVRRGDLAARIGGDEFALLLTQCDTSQAREICVRIRERVGNCWQREGADTALDVSIGVAGYRSGTSPEEWLRVADAAMYRAKETGQVEMANADDWADQRSQS